MHDIFCGYLINECLFFVYFGKRSFSSALFCRALVLLWEYHLRISDSLFNLSNESYLCVITYQ